jgi:transposase-like protein
MFPDNFTIDAFYEMFPNDMSAVEYLLTHNVLHSFSTCDYCEKQMNIQEFKRSMDGYILRCCKCKRQKSIRCNTFLENSKLSAKKFLLLTYFWSNDAPIKQLSTYTGISKRTCVDFANFLREIASWKFQRRDFKLGGVGKVVQVDESVIYKPKYNRGHALFEQSKWVFGIYDVSRKLGAVFFVEDRSAETLLPLIQEHVVPGTEIHSDEWRAYRGIPNIEVEPRFTHKTVNHSLGFINHETGIHTNNVEAYWCSVKRVFKKLNGTSRALTPSYLDFHMYCQRFGKSPQELFVNVLTDIAEKHLYM